MLDLAILSILADSAFKMGFRYGLELRSAVARFSSPRNHRRIDHH